MADPVICIMQPTYLPWMGYFDLIRRSDHFIFLDDVSFSKQSWQQRNKIKAPEGLQWLTVPVLSKGKSEQKIRETQIDSKHSFARKHLKSIELNYRKAKFFSEIFPALEKLYHSAEEHLSLARLNIDLILFFSERLGFQPKFERSSELPVSGERSDLLVEIIRHLGSRKYLSPHGALDYLRLDQAIFARAEIEVRLHQYEHPQYTQLYPPFAPYASVLDLLMNESAEAAAGIISSGSRDPVELGVICSKPMND